MSPGTRLSAATRGWRKGALVTLVGHSFVLRSWSLVVSFTFFVLLLALAGAGCADGDAGSTSDAAPSDAQTDGGPSGDTAEPGDDAAADAVSPAPFLTRLQTPADLASLALSPQGEVKYLAPVAGRAAVPPLVADCYFQNMQFHAWHLHFLQSFPELSALSLDGYLALVTRSSRRLWGGAVKPWPTVAHPLSQNRGVIVYGIYGEPGSVDAAAIRAVDERIKTCMPFARDVLVFVPDQTQTAVVTAARADLAAAGIATLFPEDLVVDVDRLVHSAGEGYGTLRVVPPGQPLTDYGPRDVVVVQSAPNDISIVAGLITRNPQNDLGHVNLRLQEKAIPNVTVPGIYDDAAIVALDGQLVHLTVSRAAFAIVSATLADAQAFWDAHRPHVRAPTADLTVTALGTFANLRASDARAYGAKAANLGELTHVLDVPNRSDGFAIPFARHASFIAGSGLAADIEAVLTDPRVSTDRVYKRARLKALREKIRQAPFPDDLFADVRATATAALGTAAGETQFLRFRSSTNVEDLDAFTGAGLYESKTGCLRDDLAAGAPGPSACLSARHEQVLRADLATRQAELAAHPDRTWLGPIIADLSEDLTQRRTVRDAIRKVWASLWEERAFDERAYYGIDHRLAHMGIAVNPSFVAERASAVAVSNVAAGAGGPLYRINSQIGSESVARPEDPTAIAELLTFRRQGDPAQAVDVQLQVRSNRVAATETIWPADKLTALAQLLFRVHDHFAAQVYAQIVPLRLDFEIKHDDAGHVVIKQVRPFIGPSGSSGELP